MHTPHPCRVQTVCADAHGQSARSVDGSSIFDRVSSARDIFSHSPALQCHNIPLPLNIYVSLSARSVSLSPCICVSLSGACLALFVWSPRACVLNMFRSFIDRKNYAIQSTHIRDCWHRCRRIIRTLNKSFGFAPKFGVNSTSAGRLPPLCLPPASFGAICLRMSPHSVEHGRIGWTSVGLRKHAQGIYFGDWRGYDHAECTCRTRYSGT